MENYTKIEFVKFTAEDTDKFLSDGSLPWKFGSRKNKWWHKLLDGSLIKKFNNYHYLITNDKVEVNLSISKHGIVLYRFMKTKDSGICIRLTSNNTDHWLELLSKIY